MANKLVFNLTEDETNKVLAALGNQPYHVVADLILNIQGQGTAQLKRLQEEERSKEPGEVPPV